MPLRKSHISEPARKGWALWEIREPEAELQAMLPANHRVPAYLTHPRKQLEWLAARVCLIHLLGELEIPYHGLLRTPFGKPLLKGSDLAVSLTHSYPWVGVRIAPENAGMDLEQFKPGLLKVAPRVFSTSECLDAGNDLIKNTVYWCAKETLIKLFGETHLTLARDIAVEPFSLQTEGQLTGRIFANQEPKTYILQYHLTDDFAVVMNV